MLIINNYYLRIDLLGTHLIACKHGGQRHQTHDFMVC